MIRITDINNKQIVSKIPNKAICYIHCWVTFIMKKEAPIEGDFRVIERFIWFPKTFDAYKVWFEKVKISQRYLKIFGRYRWVDIGLCTDDGFPLYMKEHSRFKRF